MDPVRGVVPDIYHYIFRRSYTDEYGRTHEVDNSGRIIRPLITGTAPVGGKGNIKIGKYFLKPERFIGL